MKIDDDHLYHGAALLQIAEDPRFTAINGISLAKGPSRSGYYIHGANNSKSCVYLKYAVKPQGTYKEYRFNFQTSHLAELKEISEVLPNVFLALVCVQAREICTLTYGQLLKLIDARKVDCGEPEDQYVVIATLAPGQAFRVYMNAAGVKKMTLGKPFVVPRKAFPSLLFK